MVAVNWPNLLTVLRILLVPVLVVALLEKTGSGDLFAAIVFVVASVTDAIDGYLARSRNWVTTFGKLMDPIADKLLLRVDVVPPTIIAGSSVIADDNFVIDTEFADSIATSALGDGVGKTEGLECGDGALLNQSGLRSAAEFAAFSR